MTDVFNRRSAGRSAERIHKELSRAWRVRTFGRRARIYAVAIYTLLFVVVLNLHLDSRWSLTAGLLLGGAVMATWLIPDTLLPSHIANWQLGAWGEQMTASELKRLRSDRWIVRHDIKWGERWNHDHVVAGPAVFVLNSKNLKDSKVSIESGGIRVTRIDNPEDGYLADRWCTNVRNEARSLKRSIDAELGFPIHVYPVLVLWGRFAPGQEYVGEVSVVYGGDVVEWIKSRPPDIRDPDKLRMVGDCVRGLPYA